MTLALLARCSSYNNVKKTRSNDPNYGESVHGIVLSSSATEFLERFTRCSLCPLYGSQSYRRL